MKSGALGLKFCGAVVGSPPVVKYCRQRLSLECVRPLWTGMTRIWVPSAIGITVLV